MKAKKILLALVVLFVGSKLIAQPTSPAPTPSQSSADVISVFSDLYSSISGTNFNPNWGQGTVVSDTTVSGDNIKKYGNLDYQGTQLGSRVNASSMENLHFDIWTPNATQIQIFMVNEGNTGGPTEQSVTLSLTQNGWNSLDIPMSSYHSSIVSSISQFKIQYPGFAYHASPYNFYLDNIYFWKSANVPTLSGFSFPTKFNTDAPFVITPPTSNSNGAFTYTSSNTSVATISGDTITIVGVGTSTITANQAADGSFAAASTTATLTVTFAPPTTAPPTPTQLAANVISMYSNAYTNVSGINWYPNWGQSTTILDMNVASNDIKRYSNLNYQGVEFSSLDVSTMEYLHVDVWTPNLNTLQFFLIKFSPNVEQAVTITPTKNGWYSIDIPLSSYNTVDKSQLRQFKLVGSPSGSTIYLDNIYFWKSASSPTITGFSIPAKNLGDAPFQITAPTSNSTGVFTYTSSNTNVATISGDMITIVGVGSTTITANQAADSTYNAGSTSTTFVVSYPPPPTPAPDPTKDSADVLSVFSDAYINISGTDFYPNWGQSTVVTNISVAGNTTKKYSSLNYQGVQFASPVNALTYTELHFDLWTPNCTAFDFYLINAGGVEQKVTVNPTANGWNSYDISLSQYTAINKGAIIQFKFVGTPSGSSAVYLDNIYFWRATPVTLGTFTVPAKEVGDAPFALTAPTSNSPGAFTYTSSNTSVATISGNMVTIVGAGSSTITASQAVSGNYGSASTTATLVVTFPVLPQAPIVAAPTPTKPAFNVYSLFSNAYTNIAGTNFNPFWGQSTQVEDTIIDGNTTKKYTNLNYQGIQFAGTIDASPASYLHVDIWTANCTKFELFLINTATGAEQPYAITPTLAGWNGVDIPLSAYNANIVNHVNQIKLVGTPFGGGTKVYMDNLYFWANNCINVVAQPSVSLAASANNVCAGTAITFTATPTDGGSNPNYNFKVNGSSVQNGSSNTYTSSSIANNDEITCVITRTDGCANDGLSSTIYMVIKPNPIAASITNNLGTNTQNIVLCSVGKTATLYPSIGGGSWSNSDTSSVQLSSAPSSSSASRVITGLSSGMSTINYTVTSSNGCSSTTSITVKVSPVATVASISGPTNVCKGSVNTYSSATVGGVWSGSRFTVSNLGVATATSAGSGIINYTVSNADGCSSSASLNVNIKALPSIPSIAFASGTLGVSGSGGYCKNKTFTLVGNPGNGVWSKTGVISINPTGVNSTTTLVSTGNVSGSASITYTYTDANNCSNQRTINTNIVSCGSKGTTSNNIVNDLVIYPNPAKNFVNINCNNISGINKIIVSDISGKVVLQQNLSLGLNKLDVSKLSKGMYIIATTINNENKTQKLVIE